MDRAELIKEHKRLTTLACEIERLRTLGNDSYDSFYAESDLGISLSDEGVEVFDVVPRQYEEGDTSASRMVPWAEIDNYDETIKALKKRVEARKRKEAEARKEWDRKQYEVLKAKFEK